MKAALAISMRRRGQVVVFTAISLVTLLGLAALSVDVGLLYSTRAELQASADASAHAGALVLLNEQRLKGEYELKQVFDSSRSTAAEYAKRNKVLNAPPVVDEDGDVVLGRLENLNDHSSSMTFLSPSRFNAVEVTVRRTDERNGPVSLLFANVFGMKTANVAAQATAAFEDGIAGFEINEQGQTIPLSPFALHVDAYRGLLQRIPNVTLVNQLVENATLEDGTTLLDPETGEIATFDSASAAYGDMYGFDDADSGVYAGADDLTEVNIYPGSGVGQLPPGNFGTVDIGASGNSTSDLSRQIVDGVNQSDLDALGKDVRVPMTLNGDTGLSAGIKDEVAAIIGETRIIPLFDSVWENGNNATFRIVGFAGVRFMHVDLNGAMRKKQIRIQPAVVVTNTSVSDPLNTESYFVYSSVRIVR